MITDQNANVVTRHDFLPYGEEIANGSLGRSGVFGVSANVNQKFTGQERDGENAPPLDFFQARYLSAPAGRFLSPDPGSAGADLGDPQTWNGYAYVRNNPLALVDPSGMSEFGDGSGGDPCLDDPFCGGGDPFPPIWNPSPPPPPPPVTVQEPFPPGSFPGGETLGLPPGMRIPGPLSWQVLLGLWNWSCAGGGCLPGPGSIGFADTGKQINSLYDNIIEHLEKLRANPNGEDVQHWITEIRGSADQITRKAAKVTQKRAPGALDKYLKRTIGITSGELEDLLPSPVLMIDVCAIDPLQPLCRLRSSQTSGTIY